jgi:hypothetical protein
MNKLSKKGFTLFASTIAMAAFALPSASSAATFDGAPGSRATLTSTNLGFDSSLGSGSTCSSSTFEITVNSSTDAAVVGTTFDNCVGSGGAAGCTVDATGTGFPWTVTIASSPTRVTIDNVHVNVGYTGTCALAGAVLTLGGNLGPAPWNSTTRVLEFGVAGAGTAGLNVFSGGSQVGTATVRGTTTTDGAGFNITN